MDRIPIALRRKLSGFAMLCAVHDQLFLLARRRAVHLVQHKERHERILISMDKERRRFRFFYR